MWKTKGVRVKVQVQNFIGNDHLKTGIIIGLYEIICETLENCKALQNLKNLSFIENIKIKSYTTRIGRNPHISDEEIEAQRG